MKRVLIAALAVFFAWLLLPSGGVLAETVDPTLPGGGTTGTLLVVSAPVLSFVVALIIPALRGLITKLTTTSFVKELLVLVLSAAAALIETATLEDGTGLFSTQVLFTWAMIWGVQFLTYLNVYKKLGLTSGSIVVPDMQNEGRVLYLPGKWSGAGFKSAA